MWHNYKIHFLESYTLYIRQIANSIVIRDFSVNHIRRNSEIRLDEREILYNVVIWRCNRDFFLCLCWTVGVVDQRIDYCHSSSTLDCCFFLQRFVFDYALAQLFINYVFNVHVLLIKLNYWSKNLLFNLVPRAFFEIGRAGKGPGIGWSQHPEILGVIN